MSTKRSIPDLSTLRSALAAVALTSACSAGWALPVFTFNPSAIDASIGGGPVTADNFVVSGYGTVTSFGTNFTEQGYLSVSSLTLFDVATNSDKAVSSGINSTFGLYIKFTGSGTDTPTSPTSSSGSFAVLSYELYGYKGAAASFQATAGGTSISTPNPGVLLGSGSLLPGSSIGTFSSGFGNTGAFAALQTTFAPTATGSNFFVSPNPFYGTTKVSFIDTVIMPTSSGFVTTHGGGTVNFANPVPEPATYAMLLAGLAAVGFIANRRKR